MKNISVFCTMLFLSLAVVCSASAQMNTSLYIEEVEFKRDGTVEIEFEDNTVRDIVLHWSGKEAVSVFDKNGNKTGAGIETGGPDWLRLRVQNIKPDETYTFEIRNVSYGTRKDIVYTGFFVAAPGWKIEYKEPLRFRRLHRQSESQATDIFIIDVEYDRGGHVEVGFSGRRGKRINIEWNGKEKVSVTDETGRGYDARIVEYERNKLEIYIYDAIENMNYLLEISDIPYSGERIAFNVNFTARDDWKYRPPQFRAK